MSTRSTIICTIDGHAFESPACTLREHVAELEASAKVIGLPAFSEETSARIDTASGRAYTRAHRWFIDCKHLHGGMIGSHHLADRITIADPGDWESITGVTVDGFLAGDFDTRRWFPETGEHLRVHPMPMTAETVAAYAELVLSIGGVFKIENLEVVVA